MSENTEPIILRGYTEEKIAQQIRNRINQKLNSKYAPEIGALTAELNRKFKAKEPYDDVQEQINAVNKKKQAEFQAEFNALVRREILAYREEKKTNSACSAIEELSERIDEIAEAAESAQAAAEDVQSIAEEAQNTAEEAQCAAEEAQNAVEEMSTRIDELLEQINALEDRIAELENA